MTTADRRDDECAMVVLGLLLDYVPEGISIYQVREALIDKGLATTTDVTARAGFAIRHLRRTLGHDVVIYSQRTQLYRTSLTREEALTWLLKLAHEAARRTRNLSAYLEAAMTKYGTTVSGSAGAAFDDLTDSLNRAERDAHRTVRELTHLLEV